MLVAGVLAMNATTSAQTSAGAARSSNHFAFDCLEAMREEPGNLAFSPYSAWSALTMTAGGARAATLAEMKKVLHLPEDDSVHAEAAAWRRELAAVKGTQLSVANRLWPAATFQVNPDYAALVKRHYEADLSPLDFLGDKEAARRRINGWVEEQTQSRIRDLLQPTDITADTLLVLTNAIYFKAEWRIPFSEYATAPWNFTDTSGAEVRTPMMLQTMRHPYFENDRLQAVRLPYKDGAFSMMVVLPAKGRKVDEAGWMNAQIFEQVRQSWKEEHKVVVRLPRFKTEQRLSMAPMLEGLGMRTAFEDTADFGGISVNPPLKVSRVIHQAFVQVGEKGTEAAAATAVAMAAGSAAPKPEVLKYFIADRPFLFLIVDDRNGGILFLGRVEKPDEFKP